MKARGDLSSLPTYLPYPLITCLPYHLSSLSLIFLITYLPYSRIFLITYLPYHLSSLSLIFLITYLPYHLSSLSLIFLIHLSSLLTYLPYHLSSLSPFLPHFQHSTHSVKHHFPGLSSAFHICRGQCKFLFEEHFSTTSICWLQPNGYQALSNLAG